MAIFHGSSIPAGATGGAFEDGYSLRLNTQDSAFLSRTQVGGNRRTWTMSFWVKRNNLGYNYDSLVGTGDPSGHHQLCFQNDDTLRWYESGGDLVTNAKYRDTGNWYHIVARYDSTQADATLRQRLYVNGEEITSLSTDTAVSQNADSRIGHTDTIMIGKISSTNGGSPSWYGDSYINNFHLVDGQSLGPENWGESGTYGEWKPKAYEGTHGTNGFYLPFSNVNEAYEVIPNKTGVVHSTTKKKIGNSSIYNPGIGTYSGGQMDIGTDIRVPHSDDFDLTGDYTIELWFNTTDSNGNRCLLTRHLPANYSNSLMFENAGEIRIYDPTASGTTIHYSTTTGLNDGEWHHVAWQKSGTTSTMFIDGTAEKTWTSGGQWWRSDIQSPIYIGSFGNDAWYNGYMDEIRISNSARYTGGNFTPSTEAFETDDNTLLLIHSDLDTSTNVTTQSSASKWSGNGTSHVTFSGNDIKVNTGDKGLWVPEAITGDFEITGTWYGSTGTNSTGQSVNRGFALGFFASSETYVEGALNTNNMSQIWYYDAPNQGSGAGDSFGYGQASQGSFTPTNGDTFKFCRIGGTFYWYFADVLRHTWSQTYTGSGHIILNWSGVTNIEVKNLQWAAVPSGTFVDSSGVVGGIANDASANSNHFTLDSLTSKDQVLDNPKNNYTTWDTRSHGSFSRLDKGTLQSVATGSDTGNIISTTGYHSGKWYMEVYVTNQGGGNGSDYPWIGVSGHRDYDYRSNQGYANGGQVGQMPESAGWRGTGAVTSNNAHTQGYSTFTTGDVLSCAMDCDNGAVYFAKNGVWEKSADPTSGAARTNAAWTWTPGEFHHMTFGLGVFNVTVASNFGQDGTFCGGLSAGGNTDVNEFGNFKYAPPTDYLASCTANWPEPGCKPADNFNDVIYTGNGSAGRVIPVGFQPDMVWVKNRTNGNSWANVDSVRGATARLAIDMANSETTQANYVQAFNANGFTVGDDDHVNGSYNYVAYAWKAGTSVSGTTTGSGTSQSYTGSVNTDAGFSIISYDGNGSAGHTIPHHLTKAPKVVIVKRRNNGNNWAFGQEAHSSYGWGGAMKLDNLETWSGDNRWSNTAPNNTVFTVSSDVSTNTGGGTYVAWCFHDVEGFSKSGFFYGNPNDGSNGGVSVYTGFKPAFLLIKNYQRSGTSWFISDDARNPINDGAMTNSWSSFHAENPNDYEWDFYSTGFRIMAESANLKVDNERFFWMAFAERPFKYSNAH